MISRQRRSSAATKAQTRAYAERLGELVPVLRAEIAAPPTPRGAPFVVVLMGLPGVGKSHCARLLCARLGAAHVSSDHVRSRLFIAATYAPEENATVFGAVDALSDLLLAQGHRVVIDATNLLARDRAAATATATRRGVPVVHVRIVAAEEDVRARLRARQVARSADDHSDADEAVSERLARTRTFEPPEGGHLELRSGADVDTEAARIAQEVERACAPGN